MKVREEGGKLELYDPVPNVYCAYQFQFRVPSTGSKGGFADPHFQAAGDSNTYSSSPVA